MVHSEVERIERLLELLHQSDASELEVETSGWRLRARRQVPIAVPTSPEPEDEQVQSPAEPSSVWIRSPLVGFFQPRPKPLQVGDRVKKDEVVCMIKAMGLMNEVRSPSDGRVAEVCVDEGVAVEYGQPLYRLVEESGDETST
jgi:acetyl-CoA carboxylase biotin carboxyl carrier protein